MVGERFGRLVVSLEAGQDKYTSWLYLCKCDCGKDKVVAGWLLRRGDVQSCGCLQKEILQKQADATFIHGARKTKAFSIWHNMRTRCYNKKATYYADYGGRGVTVCERWAKFANFLEDMGQPPEGMTLERADNELGYSKENCLWASRKAQANNRRSSRFIEYNGQTKTLQQWAEATGLQRATIAYRLDKAGMSIEEALTTPKMK